MVEKENGKEEQKKENTLEEKSIKDCIKRASDRKSLEWTKRNSVIRKAETRMTQMQKKSNRE